MILKDKELNYVNTFLEEEVPKSLGMPYVPNKIKSCFNIKRKDGIHKYGKKKYQKK